MKIKDSVAVVTGGASGLGEAVVNGLISRGCKVAVFDLNEQAGQRLCSNHGENAFFVKVNVADAASVDNGIKKTVDTFNSIHFCINCAGVPSMTKTVSKEGPHPLDAFEKVIDVNLNGTFNVLRLAAFEMARNEPANESGERGVIVNTASGAAFDGQMGQAAYAASKAGVCGMTLPIARDLSRLGIRINAIAPGLFMTPMIKMLPPKLLDGLIAQTEFPKRVGQPAEFADLVAHIIENPYLNGEVIRLDAATRLPPR